MDVGCLSKNGETIHSRHKIYQEDKSQDIKN